MQKGQSVVLADRLLLHVAVWHQQDLVAREDFFDHHIVVGSDPTRADLCLTSHKIADEHALLEHDGERVYVHDLGSAHAVYVNGVAVSRAQVLPGDAVQVGAHTLRMQVLHPALAERWMQAVDQDELVAAPLPRSESAALAPLDPPAQVPLAAPAAPDWLLSHVPVATRTALLAALPPAAALALQETRARPSGALGLALLKVGQGLEDFRIVRRTYTVPETYFRVGRYDDPIVVPSPLQVRRQGPAAAVAVVPSGAPWVLHRADGLGVYDEQAGVRESWARRRQAHVHIHMTAQDRLHVRVGAVTYVVCMLPLGKRPRRPWTRPSWRAWARGLRAWMGGALAVLAVGLGVCLAWAHPVGGGDIRQRAALAPPRQHARPVLEAHFLPSSGPELTPRQLGAVASWPTETGAQAGLIGVPGGSRGYRLFGLMMPEPLADPTQAPGGHASLAPDKAWLRGTERAWGKVLKSVVGGPPWLLDCDARDVQVSDGRVQAPQIAQWLVAHADAWIACYAQLKPEEAKAQVDVTLILGAHGRVRSVRASRRCPRRGLGSLLERCERSLAWSPVFRPGRDCASKGDPLALA